MADAPFKVGDIARLKSGGPNMTVTSIQDEEDGTYTVYCAWFDNKNEQKAGHYPAGALDRI